ncbi:MAG: hypothetical protein R3268_05100 [Acidiferrobacterales bacterium]|nr:hypothetical protein [Acidiferrobacterales bacterium]
MAGFLESFAKSASARRNPKEASSRLVDISARSWKIVEGPGSDESQCAREPVTVGIESSNVALIVIDAWESHPNEGWCTRLNENMPKLVTLIEVFRNAGRPIIYDSTGFTIHSSIRECWSNYDHHIEWDPKGGGTEVVDKMLREWGIDSVFWAGYSTNLCLMSKPAGFRKVRSLDWGRKMFLVRDATIALEAADTLETQALWDAACYEVEYDPNGFSCTVAQVRAALSN